MKYKLIALDVDGTLLNDDYELTDPTKEAVRAVHEAGARIVLCTGRSPLNTMPILSQLGLEGVMVTHNGGATVNSLDRSVLHEFAFTVRQAEPVISYCRARGIHFDLCPPLDMFVERLTDEIRAMYTKYLMTPKLIPDAMALEQGIVKMSIFGEREEIDRLESEYAEIGCPLSIIRSGDHFADIMHPKSTKGNALRHLADSLGIAREHILAIGNYFNDVEMIEFAGLGIAMDNSPEPVKRSADTVTASNNEEGVSVALHTYCLA
ncbi:Cof-type HAD-IIB family hydrolase [Paenibacillus sp. MBLB4367]|uniref:Cof-type HAD-IIB family hydrolase n=1 Tax=Paenibacillus sp. MBLB4367 TaxID=3384767 RepID=UPI003907EE78